MSDIVDAAESQVDLGSWSHAGSIKRKKEVCQRALVQGGSKQPGERTRIVKFSVCEMNHGQKVKGRKPDVSIIK